MKIYIVQHYYDFKNGRYEGRTNSAVFAKKEDAEEYCKSSNDLIERFELNDVYTIEEKPLL